MKDIKKRKRLLDIYFELCTGKTITLSKIIERYNICKRTAQRLIADIDDLVGGLEVHFKNKIKYWNLPNTYKKMLVFTNEDILNLYSIKNIIPDSEKQAHENLDIILKKIKQIGQFKFFENDIYTLLKHECKAIYQHPNEYIKEDVLSSIRNSILSMKKLRIKYKKDKKNENYLVCPYGIFKGKKTYLIATDDKSDNYKYFKISNITSSTETDEYFNMNEEFDIEDFRQNTFGIWQGEKYNVKLKFPIELKEQITNYSFHPTQKIYTENNKIYVEFSASGEIEICREIYKWEPKVKILEPETLKNFYKTTLLKALNKYE